MPEQPELYQLVGAALRDVAQARFMSDLFSRQISFVYESDGLLRRFPVPRVEIDEAEITLHFVIQQVQFDPERHSSRNAAMGSLFDRYSVSIVRESINHVRGLLQSVRARALDDATKAVLSNFEKQFLSDDNRELLSGRLLQYFNESVDTIIGTDGTLNEKLVTDELDDFVKRSVFEQPESETLKTQFPNDWPQLREQVETDYKAQVHELAGAIAKVRDKFPDYKITIEPNPATVAAPGAAISSIRIKSSVRNYKWSKVDVDEADLRNVRTLSPE